MRLPACEFGDLGMGYEALPSCHHHVGSRLPNRDSGVLSLWKNCYILLLDIFKALGNDACGQWDG